MKLIEPELWARMQESWAREFGEGKREEAEPREADDALSEREYPVARCPYCGNSGSTEPGSAAFEYRVVLSEPKVRMCRRCERGFWMDSETGETDPMSGESWAGIEMLHETLGGGEHVDAEWKRREEEDARDGEDDDVTPESLLERTQIHARYDETLPLQEEGGTPVVFRIVRVHDPIDPTEDEVGAAPGNRYVGLELEAFNESHDEWAGSPLSFALVDNLGSVHDAALATHEPEFDTCPALRPQEDHTGFVLFELAEQAVPSRLALGFDDASTVGVWALERTDLEATKPKAYDADPIEQIRRLGELRDQGVLTEAEFELKKKELLERL